MRRFVMTALAAAIALSAAADPVELKLGVKAGDKITRTGEFGGSGKLAISMGEQEQELGCVMGESSIEVEEVLEAKDGAPTKVKRYYVKKYNSFQIPDLGQDESKDGALLGKVVIVEVKDGKPVATCEDAGEDAEAELKKEKTGLEMDAAMLPGKPVNVGDSWEGDPEKLKKAFGGDDEEVSEAKLDCTLEGMEEKFGEKCAKIKAKVTLKGTREENGQKLKTSITLEGPVWFGTKAGRVLGMELEGKMKMSGGEEGGQKIKLTIDLKATGGSKTGVADFDAEPQPGAGEGEEEEEEEGGMK